MSKKFNVTDWSSLDEHIKHRGVLIDPWLPRAGLAMIHGEPGIGKTWLALEVALSVMSGVGWSDWTVPKAGDVMYLDGSLSAGELSNRLHKLIAARDIGDEAFSRLRIITHDLQPDGLPFLDQDAEQLEPHLDGTCLIVVDGLNTLVSDEPGAGRRVRDWALYQRHCGRSVVFIQTGDNDLYHLKDAMNTVMFLQRPKDFAPCDGVWFHLRTERYWRPPTEPRPIRLVGIEFDDRCHTMRWGPDRR